MLSQASQTAALLYSMGSLGDYRVRSALLEFVWFSSY